MAATNTNSAFMSIDGTDVSADWTEMKLNLKQATTDANYGSNREWEGKLKGLKGYSGDLTLIYDTDDDVPTEIQNMVDNDTVAIIYGPRGSTSGLPKHDQDFIVTGIDWSQMSDKSSQLVFKCKIESTDAPRSDWLSGDTFA